MLKLMREIFYMIMPGKKQKKRDSNCLSSSEESVKFSSVSIKLYDGQDLFIRSLSTQGEGSKEQEHGPLNDHGHDDARPTAESTCEQVIRYVCRYKLGLTPQTVDLFGIALKYDNTYLWKTRNRPLVPSATAELVFRMRFLPSRRKCDVLKGLDENCLRYLFFQLKDDFVNGRVTAWCNEKKEMDGKEGRGAGVLDMLITLRMQTERNGENKENVEEFFRTADLQTFLPTSLLKNSNTALVEKLFDRKNLRNSMKDALITMHRNHSAGLAESTALMLSYVKYQLDKAPYAEMFHKETYEAYRLYFSVETDSSNSMLTRVKEKTPVTITVDFGYVRPYFKVQPKNEKEEFYYIEERMFAQLTEQKTENMTWWCVHVDGVQQILSFQHEEEAVSFVTGLNSFYRLVYDYYFCLCEEMEPESLKELRKLRCHGFVSDGFMKAKLKKKNRDLPGCYSVLRQSDVTYDSYEVLYSSQGNDPNIARFGPVLQSQERFGIEGMEFKYDSVKELLMTEMRHRNIRPETLIKPQSETCDVLTILLRDSDGSLVTDEDEEKERENKRKLLQPKVFLPSSVRLEGTFKRGFQTEVSKAKLNREDTVAVKRLLTSEIQDEDYSRHWEALQESINKLMTLNQQNASSRHGMPSDIRVFIEFLGMTLTSPTMMVMKWAKFGCLSNFIKHRRPEQVLTLHHMIETALQVSYGLLFLDEQNTYHGNICCRNILVYSYDRNSITVKISDPGLITLYNEFPVDHPVNRQRMPWQKPKLFDNLRNMSVETDVYAYGTTLWEMFSRAASPLDSGQPLNGMSVKQIIAFYNSGENSLPIPADLQAQSDDPYDIKKAKEKLASIMQRCWHGGSESDQQDINPKTIVRDLFELLGSYGGAYHPYNVVQGSFYEMFKQQKESQPIMSSPNFENHGLEQQAADREKTSVKTIYSWKNDPQEQLLSTKSTLTSYQPNIHPSETQATVPVGTIQSTGSSSFITQQDQATPNKDSSTRVSANQLQLSQGDLHGTVIKTSAAASSRQQTGLGSYQQQPQCQTVQQGQTVQQDQTMQQGQTVQQGHRSRHRSQPNSSCPVKNFFNMIDKSRLHVDPGQQLGKGHFGLVMKGSLKERSLSGHENRSTRPVAVKVPNEEAAEEYAEDFAKECRIMEDLCHDNIVRFLGVCIPENFLVMEFVENGSLVDYLLTHEKISSDRQLSFSLDIAAGMEYLASKEIIHCDLAARNVLLTKDLLAKVTDFGLSKFLDPNKDYYRRKHSRDMAALWCGPELKMEQKFTVKFDVWSFGVVLWEIYSYGKKPQYPDVANDSALTMKAIQEGKRLLRPKECPEYIYRAVMLECWHQTPAARPNFTELLERLKGYQLENRESLSAGVQDITVSYCTTEEQGIQPRQPQLDLTNQKKPNKDYTKAEIETSEEANGNDNSQVLPCARTFITASEIHHLQGNRAIGQGRFGKVHKAEFISGQNKGRKIAIKYFNAEERMKTRFNTEIEIHSQVKGHPNIVEFFGILETDNKELAFVMEFMEHGNLKKYLSKCKTNGIIPGNHRNLCFLLDIAKAMEFLASKNILHLDLNAENVLLDKDLTAKICDFGLAKELGPDPDLVYKRVDAHFKHAWTAPEFTKKRQFHKKSDVYSYGVVAWEIFECGETPGSKDNKKVHVPALPKPQRCPVEIWKIMSNCWKETSAERPGFDLLVEEITSVLKHTNPDSPVQKLTYAIADGNLEIFRSYRLGAGHYGAVYKGILQMSYSPESTTVAVKVLKQDMIEKYMDDFKKEAAIMESLHHENVVRFYGVYQQGEFLVMEYVERGSLISYLQTHREKKQGIPGNIQFSFCVDIAAGMEYLSSKFVIHCDLAARNILLTSSLHAKVSDFGLAKVLSQDKDYYRRSEHKTLPIFWCAPEWMGSPNKFTTFCDVWSYGVVLWEIYSYGKTPNICSSVEEFLKHGYSKLHKGDRLPQTSECPGDVYALMKNCWEWSGEKRPPFSKILKRLQAMSPDQAESAV